MDPADSLLSSASRLETRGRDPPPTGSQVQSNTASVKNTPEFSEPKAVARQPVDPPEDHCTHQRDAGATNKLANKCEYCLKIHITKSEEHKIHTVGIMCVQKQVYEDS